MHSQGLVSIWSSTLIETIGGQNVQLFYLSGGTLNVTNSLLLVHDIYLFSVEGEVYFENTTIYDPLSDDSEPDRLKTNFTSMTSFSAINSSFSSMTFYLLKVTNHYS